MEIILSAHSEQPIYEQVYDQIKSQIMDHTLVSGTELPSIRGLAKELKVSVITIKKSYELLTQEGFVHSIKGKGTYVAEINKAFIQGEVIKTIEIKLNEVTAEAKNANIPYETLEEILKNKYNQ